MTVTMRDGKLTSSTGTQRIKLTRDVDRWYSSEFVGYICQMSMVEVFPDIDTHAKHVHIIVRRTPPPGDHVTATSLYVKLMTTGDTISYSRPKDAQAMKWTASPDLITKLKSMGGLVWVCLETEQDTIGLFTLMTEGGKLCVSDTFDLNIPGVDAALVLAEAAYRAALGTKNSGYWGDSACIEWFNAMDMRMICWKTNTIARFNINFPRLDIVIELS